MPLPPRRRDRPDEVDDMVIKIRQPLSEVKGEAVSKDSQPIRGTLGGKYGIAFSIDVVVTEMEHVLIWSLRSPKVYLQSLGRSVRDLRQSLIAVAPYGGATMGLSTGTFRCARASSPHLNDQWSSTIYILE